MSAPSAPWESAGGSAEPGTRNTPQQAFICDPTHIVPGSTYIPSGAMPGKR
jgi:hypothetical protein